MMIHKLAILLLSATISFAATEQATPAAGPAAQPAASKKATKTEAKAEVKDGKEKDTKEKDSKEKDAEAEKADPMSSGSFTAFKLRSVGPALVSGRVVAIAVNPKNKSQYFVGVASGGVWRTDNDGATWIAVFEHEGSYSIGAITLDPKRPNVVWVGTGEANSQRSVSYGDGIYRSDDSGRTWKNMGLKKSEHIARILIDPRDSNVIYVAAQGPLWGPGGDRGLYKSTDGGKSWNAVLTISENTGITDVVMDPSNPDVLIAASYQRRRHVFTIINGGPEAAIHKSTDGGKTWNKLSGGLPDGELGRIGLAISPVNPNIVYAIVETAGDKEGIYRSTDSGANWEKRNSYNFGPMYYSVLVADPRREDRLYAMGFVVQISDDGGKTLRPLQPSYVHVDNHIIWVDPDDLNHMLLGNDGGLYSTRDGGTAWRWASNLPTIQFYDVAVDNSKPFYYIYGGTQDNHSLGGPSRTRNGSGITNQDWFITVMGDGFRSQVDPEDSNTVYAESQHGNLERFDRRTGERLGIQPQPLKGELPQRWNWDSPILISPHSHTRLYFAGNQLFRSDDRGESWKAISPDLTRQIDRNTLSVMGKVWGPDSPNKSVSTSLYGNIVALTESPVKEGLLAIGTDDGLIQVTEDGGAHWQKFDAFPGVPDRTYVSRLAASRFDDKVLYASFDNHKNSDYKPYVLRSADRGRTWTSIAANLPENGTALAFVEDTVNRDLLFVGTEFGLWFTVDGGKKWIQMKGGLPSIAVRDAVIQQRESDLVLATFGRGFYVLDDLAPLRTINQKALEQEALLFPVRDALLYIEASPLGGRKKAHHGDALYEADNPPFGAIITYFLKDKFKTLKEKRQQSEKEAEKEAGKKKGSAYPALPYPTQDQLREEAQEQPPSVWLTVRDQAGSVVRQIAANNEKGISRVAWDLRYPAITLARPLDREAVYDWDVPPSGPLVMPGDYTVQLSARTRDQWRELTPPQKIHVTTEAESGMKPEALAELHKFQRTLERLERAAVGAASFGDEMHGRLGMLRRALSQTAADTKTLLQEANAIDQELNALMISLRGDSVLRALNEQTPASILDRLGAASGSQRFSNSAPSGTSRGQYAIAAAEFAGALKQLKAIHARFETLEKNAEQSGAPWTSGRIPEWQPE
ncbi:MAG TPA: hypothetical protein VNW97_13775 [Candidatus Saccharimonadales bacterium]|nr:hypothetical protein [Candidatus Saccharimonadales bacterium]